MEKSESYKFVLNKDSVKRFSFLSLCKIIYQYSKKSNFRIQVMYL